MDRPAFDWYITAYELIEDIRDRINKGLRVAEKAVRSVGTVDERELIKGMRKSYREALREGIIDSREDVDLILLAKELDGMLVTVDHGAIKWAEKLGIRWLVPDKFKDYLLSFIEDSETLRKIAGSISQGYVGGSTNLLPDKETCGEGSFYGWTNMVGKYTSMVSKIPVLFDSNEKRPPRPWLNNLDIIKNVCEIKKWFLSKK